MQKITPYLWFDHNAEEAAQFYTSLFPHSKITDISHYGKEGYEIHHMEAGTALVVEFELDGQTFAGLNGGPVFQFTEAISFMVQRQSGDEIEALFQKLSDGGQILMPPGQYPFSEKYAFIKDKFGLAWQLNQTPESGPIAPSLLFVGTHLGDAEEAVHFYTRVFKESKIDHILHYEAGDPSGTPGTVKHASFYLHGQEFMAMDGTGPHQFTFNEAISFLVDCETQEEIDYFWENLGAGGDPNARQCGWLKDRFGVSWRIVPTILGRLFSDPDKEKAGRVMNAMLKMKKIDIAGLKKAYEET